MRLLEAIHGGRLLALWGSAGEQGAFAALGVRVPEDYLANVAGWAAALEQLEAGLSVRVLREVVRVLAWVWPDMQKLHGSFTTGTAQ